MLNKYISAKELFKLMLNELGSTEIIREFDAQELLGHIRASDVIEFWGKQIIEEYGIDRIKEEYGLVSREDFQKEFNEKIDGIINE